MSLVPFVIAAPIASIGFAMGLMVAEPAITPPPHLARPTGIGVFPDGQDDPMSRESRQETPG